MEKEVLDKYEEIKERHKTRMDYGVKGMKWGEHKAEEEPVGDHSKSVGATKSRKPRNPRHAGFSKLRASTSNGVNESLSNFYWHGGHDAPDGAPLDWVKKTVENTIMLAKPTSKGLGDGICQALKRLNHGEGDFSVMRESDNEIKIRYNHPFGGKSYISLRK